MRSADTACTHMKPAWPVSIDSVSDLKVAVSLAKSWGDGPTWGTCCESVKQRAMVKALALIPLGAILGRVSMLEHSGEIRRPSSDPAPYWLCRHVSGIPFGIHGASKVVSVMSPGYSFLGREAKGGGHQRDCFHMSPNTLIRVDAVTGGSCWLIVAAQTPSPVFEPHAGDRQNSIQSGPSYIALFCPGKFAMSEEKLSMSEIE